MKVGVHEDRGRRLTDFSNRYLAILEHNGIQTVRLNCDNPDFWEQVLRCTPEAWFRCMNIVHFA